jgi:predicted acyltransferase
VLARIAVCYLATFALRRVFGWRGQTAVCAALLIGYWALMTLVSLPDGTPPNLEPSTNLGAFVDRTLFGNHLWQQSKTWDPEGLLSTLPAIATTLLGSLAGLWLRAEGRSGRAKTFGFLAVGALLVALGLVWNESFPINKGLWTSSYVLLTGGMAAALFALCYWIADVRGVRGWTQPGVVYGRNAIFVFVASGLFAKTIELVKIDGTPLQTLLYEGLFAAPFGLSAKNASLAYALANVAGWYLVLLVMDRRGLHLSV